jgi:multidrug transporter EmrE-like cation transporter
MNVILYALPTILLVVYSQLISAWRLRHLAQHVVLPPDKLSRAMSYLLDPWIASAYVAAFAGGVAWLFVVERFDVSLAFPIYIGLIIAIVTLASAVLFHDPLPLSKICGILLIVTGVVFVSRA